MSWLDPVRAALDRLESPRLVFVRDDDAGWGDDRLTALLDVCARIGCPVDVAVIPAALGPGLARRLRAQALRAPTGLHQHGYAHVNHEPTGRKCEFGPTRSSEQVAEDVRHGAAVLADLLGDVDPVFTPPWNRSAPGLAGVLADAGFEVLSRDHTAPTIGHPGLRETPVTVDWFGHDSGARWSPERLAERVARSLRQDRITGLMLHHAVTDDEELTLVGDLLQLLAGHPRTTMTRLAEAGATAGPTEGLAAGLVGTAATG